MSSTMKTKKLTNVNAAALAFVVLSWARAAAADEARAVEVIVKPRGQRWSVGSHGGDGPGCDPSCTLQLPPERYKVTMGTSDTEILLRGKTEIVYQPRVPVLRYAGGGLLGSGLVVGGLLAGLAFGLCVESPNDGGASCRSLSLTRKQQYVLIGTGAASFGAAVVGGILFGVGGESIRVNEEDVPDPPSRRSFNVLVDVRPGAGFFGLRAAF
jgi:hypothetical protein